MTRDDWARFKKIQNDPNVDRPEWFDLIVWMAAHRQEREIDETVTVPREALQFVMDNGRFEDDGPVWRTTLPEGWMSDEMVNATRALEKALKG